MSTDALLFIDANKYLDFYRMDRGKKMLAPLVEQAEHIFVTDQVVAEVVRNRIEVAANFLMQKAKGIAIQAYNVPDYPTGSEAEDRRGILLKLDEIRAAVKEVNEKSQQLLLGLLEQITQSKDEVSIALDPIFKCSSGATDDELQRARARRELGNPPGKITNALGDQISWEQILSHCKGKSKIWIISRDADYGTKFLDKGFLNQYLYNELQKVSPGCEVYLFGELHEGLEHFIEKTGVEAVEKLSPEDAAEVEMEEQSLPLLDSSLSEEIGFATRSNSQGLDANSALVHLERASNPMLGIQGALDAISRASKPMLAVQIALDAIARASKPMSGMQGALDAISRATRPILAAQVALDAIARASATMSGVHGAGSESNKPEHSAAPSENSDKTVQNAPDDDAAQDVPR